MSDYNFLYELHDKSGECLVTQSVTSKYISPVLEHIAKKVSEQERTHGQGNISVHVLKTRMNETVLVDPRRLGSLNTLVTLGVEHYRAKSGNLVIEDTYSSKNQITEKLAMVLTDPKKAKKLMEAAEKH